MTAPSPLPPQPPHLLRERRIAAICAGGLFVLTTSVALAGADWPPPPEFLGLVAALSALSGLAFGRLVHHLRARCRGVGGLAGVAALEGSAAGLGLALFLMLVSGGEPSVRPSFIDHLIWLAVTAVLGAGAALGLWCTAAGLQGRRPR